MSNPNKLREMTRQIVSALIFSSDEKLLMGKKDPLKGGVYSNCWHIPGGGVEDGENMIIALKREILEETNIDITLGVIDLVDNAGRGASEKTLKLTDEKVWCNMIFNVYRVDLDSKSEEIMLQPSDDLVELKWFVVSDLNLVKLTPPSLELFKRLGYISY